ncbi:hypothetical protein AAG570_001831 [Ranatra chinensis]|uniref:Ig-like domain-containing protein n=1 Tax=Ranatra chinensis TaxID=642074 RepID=A0ABD0Y9Q0_9HEMI
MMIPEGGSAKLVCKARGYPPPKVTWRREDGGDIIIRGLNGVKTKVTSVEGEVLTLSKVTRSEMGVYMCIAGNGVPPTVSKRLMLHVHCKQYKTNNINILHLDKYIWVLWPTEIFTSKCTLKKRSPYRYFGTK